MKNDFVKELRKIRIDNDETMKDMAERLGVTSAYLSTIENGKKDVPEKWVQKVASVYGIDVSILLEAYQRSISKIVVPLTDKSKEDRKIITEFVENFDKLSSVDLSNIGNILNEAEKRV